MVVVSPAAAPSALSAEQVAIYAALYRAHFNFAWRSLRRLGVPERELSDAAQEVFLVVYRRLPGLELSGRVTTWLYAICLRVASDWRRRAHQRYETFDHPEHDASGDDGGQLPELRELLQHALRTMPLEQRAVFIAFELEGMSGEEIAEAVSVSVPTVHSRLRLAREKFRSVVTRERAQEARARGGKP